MSFEHIVLSLHLHHCQITILLEEKPMRNQIPIFLFLILISSVLLTACGGGVERAAEAVVVEPTATSTPDPKLDLDVFMNALTESLATHNYEKLEALIGTPFSLASIGAGSSSLPATEVVNRLEKNLLPESSTPVFLPDADLSPILGEHVPTSLGPGLNVVAILFSEGWGEAGAGEAILYVSELPDMTYAWYGMVYAREGFDVLIESEMPEEKMDRSDVDSFKTGLILALSDGQRSEKTLLPLMSDSFIWADWRSEGIELEPEVAITNLGNIIPAPNSISHNAYPTFTELLDGQDAQDLFPTAVDFIHMTSWGSDGEGEAILVIDQNADGLYAWAGVLNALEGFK